MKSSVAKASPAVDTTNPHGARLPNFLVIGAGKAGTTAMWHYLRQHPEIYMSPHKEPRFFALYGQPVSFKGPGDMTRFRFVTELRVYEQLYWGVKNETAIGEASPWYLYVERAARSIKKMLPDVKLVAVSFFTSQYRRLMGVRCETELPRTLLEALLCRGGFEVNSGPSVCLGRTQRSD